MNTVKVAISMPFDLATMIDDLRKKRGLSRSKFISSILRDKLEGEKNKALKHTYDQVFSDRSICKEQLATSRFFEGIGDQEGQEW